MNIDVVKDKLEPLTFVKLFPYATNGTQTFCYECILMPIMTVKVDFRSVFRGVPIYINLATMCFPVVISIVLVVFGVPFGGSYGIESWLPFSEDVHNF